MKLGYFTMPIHPPGRNYLETIKEDREAFLMADRLGYVEGYIGEHTTDICENIPSCLAFIASLAYATRQIRLGSGTVNLPNSHPAAVAANVSMVDHMLEGRFNFGIGPGGLRSDQEVFGNIKNDRTKMFVESIDHILGIWAGTHPYDLKGEFWNISTRETMIPEVGQGVMLKPFQQPHPPIVVTVVEPYSKGVVAAAKRGWKPISANFLQPNWVATHYAGYEQGCIEAGLCASRADWRICKSIFVADEDATAKRYAKSRDGAYGYYYHNLLSKRLARGGAHIYKPDRNMPEIGRAHV